MSTEESGRLFHWLLGGAAAFLVGAIIFAQWEAPSDIDPADKAQVAAGRQIYDRHCSACHGANLEGQANWRQRLPNGRLPAPPHDASGHTWHHTDALLFGIVKEGLVPGKYAPADYESDMPAFGAILTDDEIRAVLAFIKSTWPEEQAAFAQQMNQREGGRR